MPDSTEKARSYKSTLNLPKTSFPMKASLVQNEPATLKRWRKENLYQQVVEVGKGRPAYTFHDGPPYANGSIHLGHLLNKVLKDLVVRSKTMAGCACPYVPGWDCHGLPIEHKVVQELGDKARGMQPIQIRRKCKAYAEKYVKLQSQQMQRLLTLADYDEPYLTMNPAYEAAVMQVFADLVAQGLVYRALKPVHWSIANQTALAEAELEYQDREDTSVYVLFEAASAPSDLPAAIGNAGGDRPGAVYLMIWTTTPWTLPANLAVAAHPRYTYGLYPIDVAGLPATVIVAEELAGKVLPLGGGEPAEPIARVNGAALAGIEYRHPFIDRTGRVVNAEYVTLEDGTGLVHTAPGHGQEDYQTGLREGLDVYCPVLPDGTFDDTAPEWLRGQTVWDTNNLVVESLRGSGHLFHDHTFTHSYPHDWRSKTPVIFRATDQWFVSVDKAITECGRTLREVALNVTGEQGRDAIRFIPEWGRNRMRGMLESRPDWCISRQRAWGLPIPAFYNDRGEPLLTAASVRAVAANVAKHGSDAWFLAPPEQLLDGYDPAADPDAPDWATPDALSALQKGSDIFDVWFESGSSWNAVLRRRDLGYPADLYLEGSDQHRGWFQLSLLPALGVTGRSPFKTVLTHGFMVDRDGRKMSKSGGNALDVDTLLKDYGADVCRWWVASLNPDNDIKVDPEFFRLAGEEYRKVRNTLRFLLGSIPASSGDTEDGNGTRYRFTAADAVSIDAWALHRLNELITSTTRDYEALNFRKVREALFNFCNETMSAVYLAAVKDRLYCDHPHSPRRRRTIAAIYSITHALVRLLAPILPHTAEEAWSKLPHADAPQGRGDLPSVHLQPLPDPTPVNADPRWEQAMTHRHEMLKAVEQIRADTDLDNPLDVGLAITVDAPDHVLCAFDPTDLADLCGISRVQIDVESGTGAPAYNVMDLRDEPRCERSWKRDGTVQHRSDGGMLSERDAQALSLT